MNGKTLPVCLRKREFACLLPVWACVLAGAALVLCGPRAASAGDDVRGGVPRVAPGRSYSASSVRLG